MLLLPYLPADTLITTAGRRVVVRSCSLGGSVEMVGRVTGGRSTVVRGAGVGAGGSATQACGLSPSCIFAHRRLFVCCQPEEEEKKPQFRILPPTKKELHHLPCRGEAKQLLFSS